MAISLASLRKNTAFSSPPRVVIYGPHGVGKTTLAAGAPSPVILPLEEGLGTIDCTAFPLLRSYGEVVEAIGSLATDEHDFKTALFDSLDWLEPLIWREAATRNGWKDIEDAGYGKGYIAADDVWREFFDGCSALRERGMATVFIAHTEVVKYNNPTTEPYDRYAIKLHKRASALVQEHVDCVLFANWRVSIVKDKAAGASKNDPGRARGIGGGQRVIYSEERPAFLAKNRYSMPDAIDIPDDPNPASAWNAVAAHIPYFNQQA